jgi:hypothetical protein
MNTRYRTYILRVCLDDSRCQESDHDKVFGSVQQVGLQEVHYFNSLEKFQQAMQHLVASETPSSQVLEKGSSKSSRTDLNKMRSYR